MADKKLTTEEILARARAQSGSGAKPPAEESADAPSAPAAPAGSSDKPKSTADILAAARAQASAKAAGGGESDLPAPAAPAAPKSTADILAAARAQKGGGAAPAAPKSTADILAAARAQKAAAGGDAAPAAKPAPAAATPAAATPTGVGVKEMVAAVKQVQEGKPVAPKLPAQPAKPRLPVKTDKVGRRSFGQMLASVTISPFVVAWTAMGAIGGVWSLATARFMMPNMVRELPSKFPVGVPSDYPPNTVSEKYAASRGIWIVNTDQYNGQPLLYALLTICTHLGCTPSWLAGEQKFKCPCHGSGFYITGINFEGPAPRPLERVGLALAPNGLLEVDKSLKFQEELGQWTDAKSYVELG